MEKINTKITSYFSLLMRLHFTCSIQFVQLESYYELIPIDSDGKKHIHMNEFT